MNTFKYYYKRTNFEWKDPKTKGKDSIYSYRLAKHQWKDIKDKGNKLNKHSFSYKCKLKMTRKVQQKLTPTNRKDK